MEHFHYKTVIHTCYAFIAAFMLSACSSSYHRKNQYTTLQENPAVSEAAGHWNSALGSTRNGIVRALGARHQDSIELTSANITNNEESIGLTYSKKAYQPLKIDISPVKILYRKGIFIAPQSLYHQVTAEIAKLIESIKDGNTTKVNISITGFADAIKYKSSAKLPEIFDGWQEFKLDDNQLKMTDAMGKRVSGYFYVGMPMNNSILAQLRALDCQRKIRMSFGPRFAQFVHYELTYKVHQQIGAKYRGVSISIETISDGGNHE